MTLTILSKRHLGSLTQLTQPTYESHLMLLFTMSISESAAAPESLIWLSLRLRCG